MSVACSTGLSRATLRRVPRVFGVLVFCMIFLQKIGLTVSAGSVGLDTFLLWAGLGWLLLAGDLRIARGRLILFLLLLNVIVIGLVLNGTPPKLSALAILLTLYVGFVFRITLPAATVAACLGSFQRAMTLIAVVVIAQQVLQYTIGHRAWPDLDAVIPTAWLYPGFAYLRPYAWHSPYLEPNGVFFLEPSALSQYLALAVVLEVTFFRRIGRIALFLVAVLACLAVSGPATLLLTLPFWGRALGRRLAIPVVVVGVALLGLAALSGWLDPLLARSGEIGNDQSSGHARIMLPLEQIASIIGDPRFLLSGLGPGASVKGTNAVQWPFSKLLLEYGLATAVVFHVFLLTAVLESPPSRVVATVMLIPFLFFGGGFVSHGTVMPMLLLCSLLRIEGGGQAMMSRRSASHPGPYPTSDEGPMAASTRRRAPAGLARVRP